MDARAALRWADGHEHLTITAGTKGGRPRQIPLSNREWQIKVLERAAAIQGSHHSLVPKELTWKEFREGEVRQARELLQRYGITRLHELRAAYACDRYARISGCLAPVLGGKAGREVDVRARMQVAEELGHGRIDVTNAYLGGQRS
ncbi:Integrase [compost metagenome]